jgi:hypothetical protein
MAGTEAVHILQCEIGGPVVPSAHIFAGSGKAGSLTKRLEEAIFIESKIEGVVGLKLLAKRAFKQLDIAIRKLLERRRCCGVSDDGSE